MGGGKLLLGMKEEIVAHYFKTIEWVKELENLSETVWRTPIQKDK